MCAAKVSPFVAADKGESMHVNIRVHGSVHATVYNENTPAGKYCEASPYRKCLPGQSGLLCAHLLAFCCIKVRPEKGTSCVSPDSEAVAEISVLVTETVQKHITTLIIQTHDHALHAFIQHSPCSHYF